MFVAGSNLLATWSQRKHERRLQAERDERERKQAVRVVLEELSEIEKMLLRSAATQLTWKSDDRQLPAGAWARYRDTLAVHVSDEAWRLVAHAYHRANETNWHVIELEKEYRGRGPDVHFLGRGVVQGDIRRRPHQAMESLERTLGPRGGIYTYTGQATAEEIWERADEV